MTHTFQPRLLLLAGALAAGLAGAASAQQSDPQSNTQSGTFVTRTNPNGNGKVSVETRREGGVLHRITTIRYDNGLTNVYDTSIVRNADGSKTKTVRQTQGGKTVTRVMTATADGHITGTVTRADGEVDQVEGQKTPDGSGHGWRRTETVTTPDGRTQTVDKKTSVNGDTHTQDATWTSFDGVVHHDVHSRNLPSGSP